MMGHGNFTFFPQPSNDTVVENASKCHYEKGICITERFYLISVFGSCVASCSATGNLLLIYVLSRPKLVASQLFFLLLLAVVDSFIAFSYIFLFSVQILYDYFESLLLYEMWNRYVKVLYATSHAAITGSTYLIVAASADRCFSAWMKSSFSVGQRFVGLAIIICVALVTKEYYDKRMLTDRKMIIKMLIRYSWL
uniref:G-protein coupled receptors family 1 profile domain-containing protein n=1 Tax=Romanomermis culicivorax TaxID=13658 RepID=A0A915JS62_ROMCU